MKTFQFNKNILFYLFIFLISVTIIGYTIHTSQYNCFTDDDDHYFIINGTRYLDIFKALDFSSEHGGGYPGLFLMKLFCFLLPLKTGNHPADFIVLPFYNGLRGIFIAFTLMFFAGFTQLYKKSKLMYLSAFIFITGNFFYSIYKTGSWIIIQNYNFYRYFFSLLFFLYLIKYIFKNLINSEETIRKREILFACISGYIVGSSSEILFFTMLIFYAFAIIYQIIRYILSLKEKRLRVAPPLSQIIRCTVNLLLKNIPFLFLTAATTLFCFSPGFLFVFKLRNVFGFAITKELIIDFSKYFYFYMIKSEAIYWIISILLTVILLFATKTKKEKEPVIFAIILQLSILTVYYSLIFCSADSPTSLQYNLICDYYLSHFNLLFLYKMLIIIPLYVMLSCINKQYGEKRYQTIIFVIVSIIIAVQGFGIKQEAAYNNLLSCIGEIRRDMYKLDKIYNFYRLHNEEPLIPESITNHSSNWFSPEDTNYYRYRLFVYKDFEAFQHPFTIIDDETAMKYFYEKGGTFTEEELQNIKFSRLWDNNFVLNKQKTSKDVEKE